MKAGLRRAVLLSLTLFVVIAAGLFAAWFLVRLHRAETLRLQTTLIAEQLASRLEEAIAGRLEMVETVRREVAAGLIGGRAEFETRAIIIQQQFEGFQAVNWVDGEGVIRWVVPLETNLAAIGRDLRAHPDAAETFLLAESTGSTQVTGPIRLLQGGTGFAGYFPVDRDGQRMGYINAVFRVEDLAHTVLGPAVLDHYAVALRYGDAELIRAGTPLVSPAEPFRSCSEVTVFDREWRLILAPSPALLEATGRSSALLLAASLVLATALIGFAWLGFVSRMRLETSLQERDAAQAARASLTALVESSRDVVLMADKERCLVYLNRAGMELLGIPGEARSLRLEDLLDHQGMERMNLLLEDDIAEGRWQGELTLKSQGGGEPVPLQLDAFTLRDGRGEVAHVAAIGRDLRLLRHLEAQLAQAQKLEALGRLAGGVAHDFNNLIMVIMGNAQLAAKDPRGAEIAQDLAGILEAADRASGLTRQLLAFSRRRVAEPQKVNMGGVVRGLETMLRRLIREDIELVIHTTPEESLVRADPGELEQVVVNLAVNAADAMPRGGRLGIEVENHHGEGKDMVRLKVSDTGEGISDGVRERMFDPFYTTKAVGKGTGLGLATVYAVVSRNAGSITVDSAPGRGSVFRVELPRASGTEAQAAAVTPLLRRGDETILLVEDDAGVRQVAMRVLQGLGHRVIEAADGAEARALLQGGEHRPDLVITDTVMPELGGLELIAWIRANLPDLPVLATSGYSDALTNERELRAQGTRFLAKPWTEALVSRSLREIFDGDAAA